MEVIKTGAVWIGKAYLLVLALMIAVLFIGGVLAAPFEALTGGGGNGRKTEDCMEWGNC
jgi:hypothetical protein